MLSPEALDARQRARLATLEAAEPLAAAWRFHAFATPQPRPRWSGLREVWRRGRTLGLAARRPARPKAGQVVVVSGVDTPQAYGNLRLILQELRRRGRPAFLVTSAATAKYAGEGLHDGHADMQHLLARLGFGSRRRCSRSARQVAEEIRQILKPLDDGHAESWLEVGMMAREAASRWLGQAGCVVADGDFEAWRKGFALGAQTAGMPSIILQHGLFGAHHFPLHASYLFTWGQYFSNHAVTFGTDPGRTLAVGCPRWDELFVPPASPDSSGQRARMGLDPSRPVVLLLSNTQGAPYYPGHYEAYFAGVRRLLEDGWQVVVKLHPAEKGAGAYRQTLPAELADRLVVLPRGVDVAEALRVASVAYQVASTAALEAICLGVPVLFERGGAAAKLSDFPDHGGGEWVSGADVSSRCRALVEGGADRAAMLARQEEFLAAALEHRGTATRATVDAIETTCRKS